MKAKKPTKAQTKKFKSLPPRVQQMVLDGAITMEELTNPDDVDMLEEAIGRAGSFDD